MRTEDLHIEWHDQDDIPGAKYARVLVRITETNEGVAECPLWDVWTWHNNGLLYGFQQPDGHLLGDATYRPAMDRVRRFEWTYLSWAAPEKMIEDFGRKGAPATVYCVLRFDCDSEDELQQVFDTREAAQDYVDHQYNEAQLYVDEYEVRTENEDTGSVLWYSSIPVLDIETDLKIARNGGYHPVVNRSNDNNKEGWVVFRAGNICFWFIAVNRTEATKKASDIACFIIKNEADGKYPYLRRKVFRAFPGLSGLTCPFYDFTTGELILPKNGRMEIPCSEMEFADDGTVLTPKFKEIDQVYFDNRKRNHGLNELNEL